MPGAQRTFPKSDFLIQVDYMGVVQEVTHKLLVKAITILTGFLVELLNTHIMVGHAGASVTKVAEETVS